MSGDVGKGGDYNENEFTSWKPFGQGRKENAGFMGAARKRVKDSASAG